MKKIAKITTAIIGCGITMLASFGGALAEDNSLSTLPSPFISNPGWSDTAIVHGSVAGNNDDAARDALRDYFDGFVYEQNDTVMNLLNLEGVTESVMLGRALNSEFDMELDDSDIVTLKDSTFEFDDETISYRDIIKIGDDIIVETSLTANEDDYEDSPFVEIKRGQMGYYFVFDESIDLSNVDDAEPLEINFLGKNLKIIDVDDDRIEVETGEDHFLDIDQSIVIDDKTVTLTNVGEDSVVINVGGTVGYIDEHQTEKINGVWIRVEDVFYSNQRDERMAKLVISDEQIHQSYDDGDEYIGQDEDDPDWVWDLDNLLVDDMLGDTEVGGGPTIGVVNEFVRDDYRDNPIGEGEMYEFPNNFAAVEFTGAEVTDFTDLDFEVDDSIDLSDVGLGTSETGLIIRSDEEGGIVLTGNIKTDKVYIGDYQNTTGATVGVFYEDENTNDVEVAFRLSVENGTEDYFGFVDFQDTRENDLRLGYASIIEDDNHYFGLALLQENADLNTDNNIITTWKFNGAKEIDRLGDVKDSDESFEVVYGNEVDWLEIGEQEEDHLSEYGVIIKDPSGNGNNGRVAFKIPADLQTAEITIGQGDAVIEPGSRIDPVLVTESGASDYNKLILVGGPCVNSLTAQYMGLSYPSCGAASTIQENTALVKLIEQGERVVLIVAGWEQADTLRAAQTVVNSGLTGQEMVV